MLWWQILLIVLGAIVGAALLFFIVTFALYWSNADMKLINWLYNKLGKHYDNMDRDRKL